MRSWPIAGNGPHDGRIAHAPRGVRRRVGYALVGAAAVLAAVNATAGKIVMESGGVSPFRLSELRATGSALLLLGGIAVLRRRELPFARSELPFLIVFGVFGIAFAQLVYVVSIQRLHIGVALLIANIAVVLVALWARVVRGELVQRRLWIATVLALGGLSLVVQFWRGLVFDAVGIGAALACAVGYAAYIVLAEHGVRRGRHAYLLVAWGFCFGALFWAVAQPWWSFPFELLAKDVSLLGRLEEASAPVWALLAFIVPFGTVAPFVLYATALRYLSGTQVVLVAVLEPVFGALVAFVWLDEKLGATELGGGVLVLAGVALAASARTTGAREWEERAALASALDVDGRPRTPLGASVERP